MGREGIGRARAALHDAVKQDRDSYAGEILRLAARTNCCCYFAPKNQKNHKGFQSVYILDMTGGGIRQVMVMPAAVPACPVTLS